MRKPTVYLAPLVFLFVTLTFGNAFALDHFNYCWEGSSPFNSMAIYIVEAKLSSVDLQSGDEIALFDGTECVGAETVGSTPPSFSNALLIKAAKDDGSGCGFTEGNEITVKVWDSSAGAEIEIEDPQFYDLSGNPISPVGFEALGSVAIGFNQDVGPSNTPPTATNVSLNPTSPQTSDNLVGTYSYNDADGDPESGTEIKWYKDGAFLRHS